MPQTYPVSYLKINTGKRITTRWSDVSQVEQPSVVFNTLPIPYVIKWLMNQNMNVNHIILNVRIQRYQFKPVSSLLRMVPLPPTAITFS
jgi:hypothetical protein